MRMVVTVVALVVLVEASSRLYFLALGLSPRQYFHRASVFPSNENAQGFDDLMIEVSPHSRREIHPYFGFIANRQRASVNSAGFHSQFTYPYHRQPGDYVIGVFGGSVAENFVTGGGVSDLTEALRKSMPALKEKNLIVLNMAGGASKQPQSYLIASFYAGMFDMTINLDGFNEVTFDANWRNYPSYYPQFSSFFFPADSLKNLNLHLAIVLNSWRFTIVSWAQGNSSIFSSGGLTMVAAAAVGAVNRITFYLYDEWSTHPEYLPTLSKEQFANEAVENWRNFTHKQAKLMAAWNTKSFFFIQPNLHNPNSKPLSELEKAKASLGYATRLDVGAQYEKLEEARAQLAREKLKVFNLSEIFKDVTETVYIDSCCHLNELGNRYLARAMARAIVSEQ